MVKYCMLFDSLSKCFSYTAITLSATVVLNLLSYNTDANEDLKKKNPALHCQVKSVLLSWLRHDSAKYIILEFERTHSLCIFVCGLQII